MYEICTFRRKAVKTRSGFKNVDRRVVAKFKSLAAAHEYASGKPRHCVQYSPKAIRAFAA